MLILPNPKESFVVHCDASEIGNGGFLRLWNKKFLEFLKSESFLSKKTPLSDFWFLNLKS